MSTNMLLEILKNVDKDIVGKDIVNNYTIDTRYTADAGYETAIWYENNDMVIVQRYDDRELAKEGHSKWVKTCLEESPTYVHSIQFNELEKLK